MRRHRRGMLVALAVLLAAAVATVGVLYRADLARRNPAVVQLVDPAMAVRRSTDLAQIGAREASDAAVAAVARNAVASLVSGNSLAGLDFRPVSAPARERINAFARWAPGLRDAPVRVRVSGHPTREGERTHVDLELVLSVPGPTGRTKLTDDVSVWTCPHRHVPVPCDLSDRHTGIGALTEPVVLRRGVITVLAERADEHDASTALTQAGTDWPQLRGSYRLLHPPRAVVILLAHRSGQQADVFDTPDRESHYLGQVDEDGNLVIYLDHLPRDQFRAAAFASTLRHELTHVATLNADATGKVPNVLIEGIAQAEEYVAQRRVSSLVFTRLDESHRLATTGHWPLFALLLGESPYSSDQTAEAGNYEAGLALAEYLLDRYGHDRLVRFYAATSRQGIGRALHSVLHTDLQSVTEGARQWAADHQTFQ